MPYLKLAQWRAAQVAWHWDGFQQLREPGNGRQGSRGATGCPVPCRASGAALGSTRPGWEQSADGQHQCQTSGVCSVREQLQNEPGSERQG